MYVCVCSRAPASAPVSFLGLLPRLITHGYTLSADGHTYLRRCRIARNACGGWNSTTTTTTTIVRRIGGGRRIRRACVVSRGNGPRRHGGVCGVGVIGAGTGVGGVGVVGARSGVVRASIGVVGASIGIVGACVVVILGAAVVSRYNPCCSLAKSDICKLENTMRNSRVLLR